MKDCDPYAIVKLQCFPCVVTVVHLLKQESPESMKLPELFQPFLSAGRYSPNVLLPW